MMNIKTVTAGVVGSISILLAGGCATGAGYIESGGTESIVSLDKIDIQDWQNAADKMVKSLLTSGRLEGATRQPAVLAISRITNNTQQMVDTDSLVKKIRVQLSKSGKVVTTTTVGLNGASEDPLAKSQAEYAAFMNDNSSQPATTMPDYSLSGKLLEARTKVGRKQQVTYSFQMSLTQISTGLAIWEDEVQITKQGKKNSVGW